MHGSAPRNRNRIGERKPFAGGERDRLELAVGAVEVGDLAAVAHRDSVALELAHEVVRHRLAQICAPMQQRHERAAAGEPYGGLAGGVPAAHDSDAIGTAELGLGRPGGVEDADPLVLGRGRRPGVAGTARPWPSSTARAAISCSSSSRTTWRPLPGSSDSARYGVAKRALNFRAWVTARLVSSVPVIPAGKPR